MPRREERRGGSNEGATRVVNGYNWRFTNGEWVRGERVTLLHGPAGDVLDPDETVPPEKQIDYREEENEPGPPGGGGDQLPPPDQPPPPVNPPPPVTSTGPAGNVMYVPDSNDNGYVHRFVWDPIAQKYVNEGRATRAQFDASRAGTGDGRFFGDTTHEYIYGRDSGLPIDNTMLNDINNRRRTTSNVPEVSDPGGRRVGTGIGTRAADLAAIAAGTSVFSGRTGTGPIQQPVSTPGPRAPGTPRGPWRPKPVTQPGEIATWDAVRGKWTVRSYNPSLNTSIVVPPVFKKVPWADRALWGLGGTTIVNPFDDYRFPPPPGGARTLMQ